MHRLALLSLSTLSLAGCAADEPDEPHEPAALCDQLDNRSLIETSVHVDGRFRLERVFGQIAATTPRQVGGRDLSVPSARDMFRQLYEAYGSCEGPGVDPMAYGLACRTEATLAALDPYTYTRAGLRFEAVALVNRFDLATRDAATCGEARIVYWKDGGTVIGKAGFIIELAVPPVIEDGRRTCQPIVDFWARLSRERDSERRVEQLEAFYYEGLPGMAHPPLHAESAGWHGLGQLRGNNFVDEAQWNLREVQWRPVCTDAGCEARFVLVDTKNSPSQLLFAGTHTNAGAFQTWFVDTAVPKLAAATSIGELSLGNPPEHDAYESISQPRDGDLSSVKYAEAASAALRERITGKLAELGSPLTADHVLARATATTCAGCHRVSRGADLGGGVAYPEFKGFVHVGEQGELSTMMSEVFLPARLALFQSVACPTAAPATARGDLSLTLLGKAVGEPN